MYAFALVHHQRVHQVVFIERDGIVADRAYESLLEQPDVIIINVDVGKNILQNSPQHVSCGEKLFDTIGVLSFDNGLFAFGIFPENGL